MEDYKWLLGVAIGFIIAVLVMEPGKGKYQIVCNNNNVVTILNTSTGQAWLTKVKTDGWYEQSDYLKALFYQNYYDEKNLDACQSLTKRLMKDHG